MTDAQILAVRNAAVTNMSTTVDLPIECATVIFLKPLLTGANPTGSDAKGFFIQGTTQGLFVQADYETAVAGGLAVGDIVNLRVTTVFRPGTGARKATAITGLGKVDTNPDVVALERTISNVDFSDPAAVDAYESSLIRITGTIVGNFSGAGTGYSSASFSTTGYPDAGASLKIRVPTELIADAGLAAGCTITSRYAPLWRFDSQAQPSPFSPNEITYNSCAVGGSGGGTATGGGTGSGGGTGTGGGAAAGGGTGTGGGSGAPVRIRLMAANLTSGSGQDYDLGHGARIMKGLRPDIVMIQEFNYLSSSATDIDAFVNNTFGPGYTSRRGTGSIPNGVISRYPILDSGEWQDPYVGNTREFNWARIDIPGPKDLWVISVHLHTGSDKGPQATEIIAYLNAQVPDTAAFVALGGDFNTTSRTEGAVNTLRQRFVATSPYPVDQAGEDGTNASRSKPYDWVIASPTLDALETTATVGGLSFPAGLVFDSTLWPCNGGCSSSSPLRDLPDIWSGDSAAPSMQHMGVVRDFLIPQ